MNEWLKEYDARVKKFFLEYGKVGIFLLLLLLILITILTLNSFLAAKKLQVSFLDVGQGDAILIRTPSGHDVLVDGGVDDGVLTRLADELSYFDRHLDVVVATHPDADHVTGLIPVLKKYSVDTIVTSFAEGKTELFGEVAKSIKSEGATIHVAVVGDKIIFGDGVEMLVLHPRAGFTIHEKETNDASVSLLVTYGSGSVLLTGDLPILYERSLLVKELPKNVTIYKAGHHGSKYSSGDLLLSRIQPEYSVISAGKDNTYVHPNEEALGRLKTYSQEVLSTIERGTITFLLDGSSVEMRTSR